jgi:tRNA pseudouridine38-40 synthase
MTQLDIKNIKLELAYDGNAYLGWQKTSAGPSIENTLQLTLEQILEEKVSLQAASRTDAGVHARGQVVNFYTAQSNLDLELLRLNLNKTLPTDIVVLDTAEVPREFHPTLSAKGKEYHYFICNGAIQLPQHRFYSWYCPHLLDLDKMRLAAESLIGKHNFAAFCNAKSYESYSSYEREITDITIDILSEDRLCIKVSGVNFLYKMVRNIVGTLLYVGSGKLSVEAIPAIIKNQNRTAAGITAPAHGLVLHKVFY